MEYPEDDCKNCGGRIIRITDDSYFDPSTWYHKLTVNKVCSIFRTAGDDNQAAPASVPA